MTDLRPQVCAIYTASEPGGPQAARDHIELVAGEGIVGDRYRAREQDYPGQNLTLVEAEEIERFNSVYQQQVGLDATRRNLVTRNVRLNELVGRTFHIGAVAVRGVELCEPCKSLGERLAGNGLSVAQVVKAFVHRGGLRVDVLSDGRVHQGDEIRL